MKIAVIYTGETRSVAKCNPTFLNNVIKNHHVDNYIVTWENYMNSRHPSGSPYDFPWSNEEVFNRLNPIDTILLDHNNPIMEHNIVKRFLVMFYLWKLSNKFLENKHYDMVIRTRFDLLFENDIDIMSLDLNLMNIPNCVLPEGGVNDQFCISNQKNMQIYNSVFDHCESYYNQCKIFPETLLYHHLINNNLIINPIDLKYQIIRR